MRSNTAPSEISVSQLSTTACHLKDHSHKAYSTASSTAVSGSSAFQSSHQWHSLFVTDTTASLYARPREHQPSFYQPNPLLFPHPSAGSDVANEHDLEGHEEDTAEFPAVGRGGARARSVSSSHSSSAGDHSHEASVPLLRQLLPEDVTGYYETLMSEERAWTQETKGQLDASWKHVEEMMEKNKQRQLRLQGTLDNVLLQSILGRKEESATSPPAEGGDKNKSAPTQDQSPLAEDATTAASPPSSFPAEATNPPPPTTAGLLIWDRSTVMNNFSDRLVLDDFITLLTKANASSSEDFVDSSTALGERASLFSDRNTTTTGKSASSSGRHTTASGTQVSAATAASLKARELVRNSQSHPTAPLRRVFKPILEKRASLPRELTILLNAIEAMQKTDFVELEETLKKSPVPVPVHFPLQRIAQFVSRVLSKPAAAALREQTYVQQMKPILKHLEEDYGALTTLWTQDDTCSEKKLDATMTMWKTLFQEISTRGSISEEWALLMAECEEFDATLRATLPAALDECVQDVKTDIANLRNKAASFSKKSVDSASSTVELLKEIDAAYQHDTKELDAAITGLTFQVHQSHSRQEKSLRKIREVQKELLREQQLCEMHTAELVDRKVKRSLVSSAYEQLKSALKEHCEAAEIAKKASEAMEACLVGMEKAASKILSECRKHLSRITSEEHFRLCRIADYGVQNTLQWFRATHDVEQLYEARTTHVNEKSDASWQLGYLLTQERQHCNKNLSSVRSEFVRIDAVWSHISSLLERLSLPLISLRQTDGTERHVRLRMILKSLDDDGTISRQFSLMFDTAMVQKHNLLRQAQRRECEAAAKEEGEDEVSAPEGAGQRSTRGTDAPQSGGASTKRSVSSPGKVVLPSIGIGASSSARRSSSITPLGPPVGLTPRPPARDASKTIR